jgi:hypothetical protein
VGEFGGEGSFDSSEDLAADVRKELERGVWDLSMAARRNENDPTAPRDTDLERMTTPCGGE